MEIYLAGLQRVNVHVQCVAPILTVLDYRYQKNLLLEQSSLASDGPSIPTFEDIL